MPRLLVPAAMGRPHWPDALPWAALTFSLAAVAVVWRNRTAMLARTGATTTILAGPPDVPSDAAKVP